METKKMLFKVKKVIIFDDYIEAESRYEADRLAFELAATESTVIVDINSYTCFECRDLRPKDEEEHYWYAFDMDNRVCGKCAKTLKHTETSLRGMPVR